MTELPFRVESVANKREHWTKRAKRSKEHRAGAALALWMVPRPALPCKVTLTRVAPRRLDSDNLAGAFKALRDGVADWLGVDDGDDRLTWCYRQETARGVYTAWVEFA